MSNKTFTFAGVSRLNGVIKARFANDQMRVKVLMNGGHKDIDITELMRPMSKVEAVESLLRTRLPPRWLPVSSRGLAWVPTPLRDWIEEYIFI
jgi:hypothetical protein